MENEEMKAKVEEILIEILKSCKTNSKFSHEYFSSVLDVGVNLVGIGICETYVIGGMDYMLSTLDNALGAIYEVINNNLHKATSQRAFNEAAAPKNKKSLS